MGATMGLYRDCDRDPFPRSLLSTRQFRVFQGLGFRVLKVSSGLGFRGFGLGLRILQFKDIFML